MLRDALLIPLFWASLAALHAGEPGLTGKPWIDMDYGPFFTCTLEAPGPVRGNFAYKGIIVPLKPDRSANVVFDTDLLRAGAGWSGGFIDWKNIALDGSHNTHPSLDGTQVFGTRPAPGWGDPRHGNAFADPRPRPFGPLPRDWARWRGLYLHGDRAVLSYTVGETGILESYRAAGGPDLLAFERTLNLDRVPSPLLLAVCDGTEGAAEAGERIALLPAGGDLFTAVAASVTGGPAADAVRFNFDERASVRLQVPAAPEGIRIKLLLARIPRKDLGELRGLLASSKPPEDLTPLTRGGPARWPQALESRGSLGGDREPYAIDDLRAPLENPWRSWMRLGGLDFFEGGSRACVCTWMGDVWTVDGIDDGLEKLVWRRIAAGLFQPLGLRIVDGRIHVLGRDQITVLHDLNGDGEADFYENFNNDHQVTEHFHEFAMDLQTGPGGDFYYLKAACHAKDAEVPQHGSLLEVSRDGSRTRIIAGGMRAPNGLAIGPGGEMVTTDQEGHWTPMNRIDWLEPGSFQGYRLTLFDLPDPATGGPFPWKRWHDRPLTYARPLSWVHKTWDRSPSEPLWVESGRWGLERGSLIALSYGTGKIWSVLHERVDGQPQGGIVRLPVPELPTGIMRGRFHPRDGQLYVCGLYGWSSNKTLPGGLYRVRYTGKPLRIPAALHATRSGVLLSFRDPLERTNATDRGSWAASAWNYHWREDYGSDDFRLSEWKPGRDRLEVVEARLSKDGRAAFLAIRNMPACMQLQIQWNLRLASGERTRGEVQGTVNVLGEAGAFSDLFDGALPEPMITPQAEAPLPQRSGQRALVTIAVEQSGGPAGSTPDLRSFAGELEERCGARATVVPLDPAGAALPPEIGAAGVLVLVFDPAVAARPGTLETLLETRKPLVVINDPARRFTYRPGKATLVTREPEAAGHPLLAGVPIQFRSAAPLAYVLPLPQGAKPLLSGQCLGPDPADPRPVINPVAWIEDREGKRRFHTTLGAAADFQSDPIRRLLRNAVRWALGE